MSGVIPPLSSAAWAAEVEKYQRIPQYERLNAGMSLAEFRAIYLWEYGHRLIARLVGLAFVVPLLWFTVRRRLPASKAFDLRRTRDVRSAGVGQRTGGRGARVHDAELAIDHRSLRRLRGTPRQGHAANGTQHEVHQGAGREQHQAQDGAHGQKRHARENRRAYQHAAQGVARELGADVERPHVKGR